MLWGLLSKAYSDGRRGQVFESCHAHHHRRGWSSPNPRGTWTTRASHMSGFAAEEQALIWDPTQLAGTLRSGGQSLLHRLRSPRRSLEWIR